jgi:signal recognition particle subunit SEC65
MAITVEFTKHNVIELLKEIKQSAPTPQDDDHPAHWWNENFGMRIKNELAVIVDNAIDRVEQMRLI